MAAGTTQQAPAGRAWTVADEVGATLVNLGVDTVFSLIGTSNVRFTAAMCDRNATLHRARHENGVVAMATAWARLTQRVGICTLAKGAGVTHAVTAMVEAHKSSTPVLVLAGDTPPSAVYSSPAVAQEALAAGLGLAVERVHGATTASRDVLRAYRRAEREQRPVLLMVDTSVQVQPVAPGPGSSCEMSGEGAAGFAPVPSVPAVPSAEVIAAVADLLSAARRPVILAGRGAVLADSGPRLRRLAERSGALLTNTILAHGIFAGDPYALGICGGYASKHAVERLIESDLVVAFGASLNDWTTRAGDLFKNARVVQFDSDARAFDKHQRVYLAATSDAGRAAEALLGALAAIPGRDTWRTREMAEQIAQRTWRNEPVVDHSTKQRIDPRVLAMTLQDLLPDQRTLVTDGGGFQASSVRLEPDSPQGWLFPLTFVALGLALPSAIGAAIARPGVIAVASVGDGGALMSLPEFESMVRMRVPVLVVVYNDAAHGGEVGAFTQWGLDPELVKFDDVDFAGLARSLGAQGMTVRRVQDLASLRTWLADPQGPMVVDAKTVIPPGGDPLFHDDESGWVERLLAGQGM